MDTRNLFFVAVNTALMILASPLASAQEEEPLSRRILKWTEGEQIGWLNSYLREGMPVDDTPGMLVLNRTSITLPVLEHEIEEILSSSSPRDLFNVASADPQRVIWGCAAMIAYAGDEVALLQVSKLIKIDEQRFGDLVSRTLFVALGRGNQYVVAYRGFEIGDPAIDQRISAWLDERINAETSSRLFERQIWAKALLERYQGVPNETQWAKDPIASHLKPAADNSLRDEMFRLTAEALRKRAGSR